MENLDGLLLILTIIGVLILIIILSIIFAFILSIIDDLIDNYEFKVAGIIDTKKELNVFKELHPMHQLQYILDSFSLNDIAVTSKIDVNAAIGINTIIEKEEI